MGCFPYLKESAIAFCDEPAFLIVEGRELTLASQIVHSNTLTHDLVDGLNIHRLRSDLRQAVWKLATLRFQGALPAIGQKKTRSR
jgi:hypothetical protein